MVDSLIDLLFGSFSHEDLKDKSSLICISVSFCPFGKVSKLVAVLFK